MFSIFNNNLPTRIQCYVRFYTHLSTRVHLKAAVNPLIGEIHSSSHRQAHKPKDYYNILGVTRFSNQKEIRSAYLKAAKKHHPDTSSGSGSKDQMSSSKFLEISDAYEVLCNDLRRQQYDAEMREYHGSTSSYTSRRWGAVGNTDEYHQTNDEGYKARKTTKHGFSANLNDYSPEAMKYWSRVKESRQQSTEPEKYYRMKDTKRAELNSRQYMMLFSASMLSVTMMMYLQY